MIYFIKKHEWKIVFFLISNFEFQLFKAIMNFPENRIRKIFLLENFFLINVSADL